MDITDLFKNKLIIIAEHQAQSVQKINSILKNMGFNNIKTASDGSKIYEILRPYHNKTGDLGLIIVNEDLPQCQVQEMCRTLSYENEGIEIPVIVLTDESSSPQNAEAYQLINKNMVYHINKSRQTSEFIMLVKFFLMLKHERSLRTNQEERLISELADRKIIDAKLKYFVAHDELTGLLNRAKFENHIRLILNRDANLPQQGSLLFIDIDRFGLLNELEGFEVGDRLIVEVVDIIRQTVLADCLIARIGSDEFCVYLDNKADHQVKNIAEKIRKNIDSFRFLSGDVCYNITVSIGIASLYTSKAVTHPGDLITRAHLACHLAKDNGRNSVWTYNDKDNIIKQRHRDLYWVPIIRDALREKSFFFEFQPVVDLQSAQISHYEVLIRMVGNSGDPISPAEFIPVAERMGLIHSIDLWVVENAIDFLSTLPAEMSHINLAINLSSVAFQDESLLPAIQQKLNMTWVKAERITFEITETAAIDNFEKTRELVTKIRALGCHFALDDFGAGFCSFNYLKRFPVDYIKIDGQFIQNLIYDETDQVLVKSMCEIARQLGKKTIAEYVENPELIDILKKIGVNFGQGYILGRPATQLLQSKSISLSDFSGLNKPKSRLYIQ